MAGYDGWRDLHMDFMMMIAIIRYLVLSVRANVRCKRNKRYDMSATAVCISPPPIAMVVLFSIEYKCELVKRERTNGQH